MLQLPFLNRNSIESQDKFLAININADSVKCLAFYNEVATNEGSSLKIIGQTVQKVPVGSVRAGVVIEKDEVVDSLNVAIQSATGELGFPIKNVIFGISADVCIENVVTAKANRGITNPITKKELHAIMQRLTDAAYNQAQKAYTEATGNSEITIETVTTSPVYNKINNMKVLDLENNTGQVVEIAIYNAFSTQFHIKSLQYIAKKLNLKISAISSNNFAVTKLIEQSNLEKNDYVLMEIGSDYTSIGVVFGGAIVSNKTFHIGTKHFIEEIRQIMGITFEEAEGLLEHHEQGKLTKSESLVVQDCLEEVLEIWLRGLELTFHEFSEVKTFSSTVYLFGSGTQIPEILELLDNKPWPKSIPFKSPPYIKVLNANDFDKIISNSFLETLALGSIYEGLLQ